MSERLASSHRTNTTNKLEINRGPKTGIVLDVILDETHNLINDTNSELFSGKDVSIVNSCVIRPLQDNISNKFDLTEMKPYDNISLDLPLIGEIVELIEIGNVKYYKRITDIDLNLGNAKENADETIYPNTDDGGKTAANYNTTAKTGITNTSDDSPRDSTFGEYFTPNQVNPLKLYEGDKLIQSRFGQSIRFSGYNNAENEFAPTIIIRNKQNGVSLSKLKLFDLTDEDINRDGSIIVLGSGKYQLPFQPGLIDDNGKSNFETKPDNFKDYPTKLDGDQMLFNSDRIIFSSRAKEMIFYSKGNWGFISDGIMSIDNGKFGANLNFNGDVRITTNDNNTYILGGKGNVFLNTESEDEHLVRGDTLVKILEELIDAINLQVYKTPTGPTAPGPLNKGSFSKIKSKLNDIKSTLNFTE